MKERPILFNGEMVRAILEGRKTQTRRLVKSPLKFKNGLCWDVQNDEAFGAQYGKTFFCDSPYGVQGDRFWVRETWAIQDCGSRVGISKEHWPDGFPVSRVRYPATDPAPNSSEGRHHWWNKRPSIHMPRWASRINLEVLSVRVERIQDIYEEDAKAEGIKLMGWKLLENGVSRDYTHRDHFEALWQTIYGDDAWTKNPWVWVIEFKKIQP